MSTTLHCTTVREWQQALKWPPDKADEAKLDELITARTHAAMTKGRELGVHESGLLWIREYDGLTARGTHLFSGHVPTLWDGYNFYNAAHKQGGWRWVAAWEYMPYRQVAIHPAHRLVLTYCEGDLTLTWAPDRDAFARELRDAHLFYTKSKH